MPKISTPIVPKSYAQEPVLQQPINWSANGGIVEAASRNIIEPIAGRLEQPNFDTTSGSPVADAKLKEIAAQPTKPEAKPQPQTSVAPSLMTGIDLSGKGASKAVGAGANGTTLYSNVEQPNPVSQHNSPNNSTPQSRFVAQQSGYDGLRSFDDTGMDVKSPTVVRTGATLPTQASVVPAISARVPLNDGTITGGQPIPTVANKPVPTAQPAAAQAQSVTPVTAQPQAVPVPVTQTAEQQRVYGDTNATAIQKNTADKNAAIAQARQPQEPQAEAPPSIRNGKLVQQQPPTLLTPPPAQPQQRGYAAPQIQGILSAENQAGLNDMVTRNLATINSGTSNFSDALATKYAYKGLETALGKDTQTIEAGQQANTQAQDESQYQRTAKQKADADAWANIMGVDKDNYGKLKDQKATESAQQNSQYQSAKDQLEQTNKDREFLNKPFVMETQDIGEDGKPTGQTIRETTTVASMRQRQAQEAADANIKALQQAAADKTNPERQKQAIDILNKMNSEKR
jgi:hypothetical protein